MGDPNQTYVPIPAGWELLNMAGDDVEAGQIIAVCDSLERGAPRLVIRAPIAGLLERADDGFVVTGWPDVYAGLTAEQVAIEKGAAALNDEESRRGDRTAYDLSH